MFVKNPFMVPAKDKTRFNTFDLSHDVVLSCREGALVPFLCEEVLPNDSWQLNAEVMVRFQPLLSPVYQHFDICTEWFYVPNRIIMRDWEAFIAPDPNRPKDVTPPYIKFGDVNATISDEFQVGNNTVQRKGFGVGSLSDYLGFPVLSTESINPDVSDDRPICVLKHLAYQKIYNDYYRDENLQKDLSNYIQNDTFCNLFDANGYVHDIEGFPEDCFKLRYRCWSKDYITTILPRRQAGNPVHAPIDYLSGSSNFMRNAMNGQLVTPISTTQVPMLRAGASTAYAGFVNSQSSSNAINIDNSSSLGVNVFELGIAQTLQRVLQKLQARGVRYKEQIMALFNSDIPDYRLTRPLYLGGNRAPLQVGEVLQTSAYSDVTDPSVVGSLYGRGIGYSNAHTKHRHVFPEHGFVVGLVSVVPRASYANGLGRIWSKLDRLDYAIPDFCNVGDQEVKRSEISLTTETSTGSNPTTRTLDSNDEVFGYQQRYAEYKFIQNSFHGDFLKSLDFWHQGRKFSNTVPPVLNADMVECRPDQRIFALQDETDNMLVQIHNSVIANRPLTLNL